MPVYYLRLTPILNAQIEKLIESGLAEYEQGNSNAAFSYYNEAFALEPRNPLINYHIGSLLMDEGDYGRACLFIESAVARAPKNALFQLRLGSVLFYLEDFSVAKKSFEKALKLDKNMVSGWLGLGRCQRLTGNLVEAKRSFKTAIKRDSYSTDALVELGFAYLDPSAPDTEKAQRYLSKADQLRPGFDSKLAMLHVAAEWQNKTRVLPLVKDALQYTRGDVDKLSILVATMNDLNIKTGLDAVRHQLAVAQFNYGDIDLAIDTLRTTLEANEKNISALISLAAYLSEKALYSEAELNFKAAFKLIHKHPHESVELLYRHAIYLKQRGNLPESRDELLKALLIDKYNCQVLYGLAVIAELMGKLTDALDYLDDALQIDPNNAEYNFEKSLIQLSQGQFSSAWPLYLARIPTETGGLYLPHPFKAKTVLPLPSSSLIDNGVNTNNIEETTAGSDGRKTRRICVLKEQSLSEQIFFLRFAPILEAQNIEVVALVSPDLKTMLSRSNGFAAVYTPDDFTPEAFDMCDLAIGMGDLPLVCQHDSVCSTPAPLTLIPDSRALIRADDLLANYPSPYLGVTWEAEALRQPGQACSVHEHVPLKDLLLLLKAWRGTVVILQREPSAEDRALIDEQLGNKTVDLGSYGDDLETTLALTARLDHYVGVSNTNMHLYAGLNKPASVLVPFAANWCWMHEGSQSSWFPDFNVYRQNSSGSWLPAIESMQSHLCG